MRESSDDLLSLQRVKEEAIAWHLRLADGSDDDWVDFARWLDADPAHNDVYEAVCDADLALDPVAALARSEPAPRINNAGEMPGDAGTPAAVVPFARKDGFSATGHPAKRLRGWKWPAMAASVALAAVGSWAGMGGLQSDYTVRTAAGETRDLALSDGTRITMNGGTEIVLDKSDPRVARLKQGEAQFAVQPDAVHPFTLTVGDRRVIDTGNLFNVRSGSRGMRVEVAQGAVRVEDGVTRLRLDAGDTLDAGADGLVEGSIETADVGGWTRGRLVYRDAPLMRVAADLTRARGIVIELGPDLSDRRFSGVIQLSGNDRALQHRVARQLGVKVTASSEGWSITR